ncbi:conserved hypothetical protein [Candidatus Zixiibacteriota bacterium]|nr:conserved hypothetical protein [candidate division Zixibacteria bacterium]
MSGNQRGQFSASAPTLGYFYQCRYALLEALRRLPSGDRICVSIETLDDVVFETDGTPIDILQTKHHINSAGNLGDASIDLWKTLRIWVEGQSDGSIPLGARFFLITTSLCSEGTAVAYLRPTGRNVSAALERLRATATTSTNQTNAAAYQVFRELENNDQVRLVESITVLDSSPSIGQLDDDLHQAIFHAVERQHLGSFLQRLEGWWFQRVIKHLLDDEALPILGEELEAEESHIRSQFRQDNLPIDDDIMQESVDATGYLDRIFVEQLKLIGVNQNRILSAITNYYRAFTHRSRWIRENLIYVGDLERYERKLIEEWDVMFQQMRDELGNSAAENAKTRAAQQLYKWIEAGSHIQIRPAVTEPAIARGTYQMLADGLKVGWHLEFRDRLEALLSGVEASQ